MKKITIFITLIFLVSLSTQLLSYDLIERTSSSDKSKGQSKTNYSVEETTELLKDRKLGNFSISRDNQIFKCIKISKNARDLEGAIDVLIALNIKLGPSLDDDEVNLLIRLSKINTEVYNDVVYAAKKIGKKKTTIKEILLLLKEFERGNGEYLLIGIERAIDCNYLIDDDYFSTQKIKLLVDYGMFRDEEKLLDIYDTMRSVGMAKEINTTSLEFLYKTVRSALV